MERMTRDMMLMSSAAITAERGTCSRLKVGAVFSREGRILSTGYNGAPAGMPHCEHETWLPGTGQAMTPLIAKMMAQAQSRGRGEMDHLFPSMKPGLKWSFDNHVLTVGMPEADTGCQRAGHAELNGILWAARYGIQLHETELHVTHMPCMKCAMALVNAGITKVTYWHPYRIDDGVRFLEQAGIQVVDFEAREGVE